MPKHSVSEEDKALFRDTVNSTNPVDKTESIEEPQAMNPQKRPPLHLSSYYQETVESHTILSFCRPGISKKYFNELQTGKLYYQNKLDLHGLIPDEAQDALVNLIRLAVKQHHRCILVIHGKGGRKGEAPILKNLTNHWLKQIPEVLAFHSALPKDGGSGALYVLLKRSLLP